MSRYNGIGTVVTIGTFDGVHKGHQEILNRVAQTAQKENLKSVVVAFEIPVKKVSGILTTPNEKFKLLSGFNINDVVLLPVTRDVTSITAENFFEKFLIEELGASHIIVGQDCTFGKNREGNINWLKNNAKKYGVKFTIVEPVIVENRVVSSSLIRELLEKSRVNLVREMLGRNFSFDGYHISGKKIGRTLGFPTINIRVDNKKLLPRGVFSCRVIDEDFNIYRGVLNIGLRPSVKIKDHNLSIEVHLLNFSGKWYSKRLTVVIDKFIRPEKKFNNLEELKKAIAFDIKKA